MYPKMTHSELGGGSCKEKVIGVDELLTNGMEDLSR